MQKRHILNKPAFKFKELFQADGLKQLVECYYIRHQGDDLPVLIQPVQFFPDIFRTKNALDGAKALVDTIRSAKVSAQIAIVVDELPTPSSNDSDQKKWAFDYIQAGKEDLNKMDVEMVDSIPKTIRLSDSIEKDLAEIESTTVSSQTELVYD